MHPQSSLGRPQVHRLPSFHGTFLGRVTSTSDFDFGRIEVVLLDGGTPVIAWVVGDISRKPVEGDKVLISYIDGRPDTPYLVGFVHKDAYSSDSIRVEKGKITLQFPNGAASVVLTDDGTVSLQVGTGHITLTKSGIDIYHPNGVTIRSNVNSTTI